jgi:hypothetical protein
LTVKDELLMSIEERLPYLRQNIESSLLWKRLWGLTVEALAESTLCCVWSDNIRDGIFYTEIDDREDVRMLQLSEVLGFLQKRIACLRRRELYTGP